MKFRTREIVVFTAFLSFAVGYYVSTKLEEHGEWSPPVYDTEAEKLTEEDANEEEIVINESSQIDSTINQKDSLGRYQGFWAQPECDSELFCWTSYNDSTNGPLQVYSLRTGRLMEFGWYEMGKPVGESLHFDENGTLTMREQHLEPDKSLKVKTRGGKLLSLPFRTYSKIYHKNEVLAEEGMTLSDGEEFEEESYRVGKWKYYDEQGKLLKEEEYPFGEYYFAPKTHG